MQTFFQRAGRFWKGNLHTHSTCSDGCWTPEAVCALYRRAGYHFLAITDHFSAHYGYPLTDTSAYQTTEFITFLGAELHAPQTQLGEDWHIVAVGLPPNFAPNTPDETGPGLAARALAAGAFVFAPHPAWYSLSEADILSLGPIHAIEIFNGTARDDNDRADGWYLVDRLLAQGGRYHILATDDAHFAPTRDDACLGWVMVKSETLTPDAILAALKRGDYYASTGPEIYDVRIENNQVIVDCSPASQIFITGRGSDFNSVRGTNLVHAELALANWKGWQSPYVRVTVRDIWGRRAWTNALYLGA